MFELEPLLAAEWVKPTIKSLPGIDAEMPEGENHRMLQLTCEDYSIVMRVLQKYAARNEVQGATDGVLLRMLCQSWEEQE